MSGGPSMNKQMELEGMETKPSFAIPYLTVKKCQDIMDSYKLDIYQHTKESILLCQVIEHLEEELKELKDDQKER